MAGEVPQESLFMRYLSIFHEPLFPFLSTKDILPGRLVCSEFKETITQYVWNDINTVILGDISKWRQCFPKAKAANIKCRSYQFSSPNGRTTKITSDDIKCLEGIKYLNISNCNSITDNDFQYLKGIICLIMNNCNYITDKAFEHLSKDLKRLEVSYCNKITNKAFPYLTSLKYLNIINNSNITDEAFQYIPGIIELNIAMCSKITDKAFTYLTKLKALNISKLRKITPQIFDYDFIKDIFFLVIDECSDDLICASRELKIKNCYDNWREVGRTKKMLEMCKTTIIRTKIY